MDFDDIIYTLEYNSSPAVKWYRLKAQQDLNRVLSDQSKHAQCDTKDLLNTRGILMSQFHTISHDLSHPVDTFLQAVVTTAHQLTAIAVSFPMHMVQDKILSSLLLAYSPIVTLLQFESESATSLP